MKAEKNRRLLLVQKSRADLRSNADILVQKGFEVFCCNEIDAAFAIVYNECIDILITEAGLEGQTRDGTTLAAYVNSHQPKTKVFFLGEAHKIAAGRKNESAFLQNISRFCGAIEKKTTRSAKNFGATFVESLDSIIKNNGISTVYQPIFTCDSTPKIIGAEALARVNCFEGKISPEVLFSLAASKSLLFEVDLLCIEAALSNVTKLPFGKLFVNLRPSTLTHPKFLAKISKIVEKQNIKFDRLVFEVTEQDPVWSIEELESCAKKINRLGAALALDDFGTGISNLDLLYSLKPQYLKISGFFTKDLESEQRKQLLVQTIAAVARKLKTKTVLENVESKQEFDIAQKLGIDFAQGYFLSQPLVAKDFDKIQ